MHIWHWNKYFCHSNFPSYRTSNKSFFGRLDCPFGLNVFSFDERETISIIWEAIDNHSNNARATFQHNDFSASYRNDNDGYVCPVYTLNYLRYKDCGRYLAVFHIRVKIRYQYRVFLRMYILYLSQSVIVHQLLYTSAVPFLHLESLILEKILTKNLKLTAYWHFKKFWIKLFNEKLLTTHVWIEHLHMIGTVVIAK